MRALARLRASLERAEARAAAVAEVRAVRDDNDGDGDDASWRCFAASTIPASARSTRSAQKQYPSTGTRSVVGCLLLLLLVGTGW